MTGRSAKDYVLIDVAPDELHNASYEPDARLQVDSAFNKLKKSIEQSGLQYPPLVSRRPRNDGFDLIDGHRRANAIRRERLPVLVASGDPAVLFRDICATTRKLNATEWIDVYLKGGQLQSGATKSQIAQLDKTMGRGFLEKLRDAGMSPTIWAIANKFIDYTKIDEPQRQAVLNWLFDHRITRDVGNWISGNSPVPELVEAFQQNRKPTLFRQAA
jgi:hypothetical protein